MDTASQELQDAWNRVLELDTQVAKLKKEKAHLVELLLQARHQAQLLEQTLSVK